MTKTAEIVERLRDAVRGIRFAEGHHLVLNKMQAEMLCTPAAEASDHLEALEARLEKAREGLREIVGHCANTGRGNEIVDSRSVDRVDDAARRTLSEIDAESEPVER